MTKKWDVISQEPKENILERFKLHAKVQNLSQEKQNKNEDMLDSFINQYGPVIDGYPTWHPFINRGDYRNRYTVPNRHLGYEGIDKLICFSTAFIAYGYGDPPDKLVNSLKERFGCCEYEDENEGIFLGDFPNNVISMAWEKIDYHPFSNTDKSVLVYLKWESDNDWQTFNQIFPTSIPGSIAIPLMINLEMSAHLRASYSESWEDLKRYLLGEPYGENSSLFLSDETVSRMKKIHNLLCEAYVWGPPRPPV